MFKFRFLLLIIHSVNYLSNVDIYIFLRLGFRFSYKSVLRQPLRLGTSLTRGFFHSVPHNPRVRGVGLYQVTTNPQITFRHFRLFSCAYKSGFSHRILTNKPIIIIYVLFRLTIRNASESIDERSNMQIWCWE